MAKHQNEEMMANLMWKMPTNLSRKNGKKHVLESSSDIWGAQNLTFGSEIPHFEWWEPTSSSNQQSVGGDFCSYPSMTRRRTISLDIFSVSNVAFQNNNKSTPENYRMSPEKGPDHLPTTIFQIPC